jgi:hypothetical protein
MLAWNLQVCCPCIQQRGECTVLSSISGQTDRWAQLAAMQDSPLIPSSQSNGGGSGMPSTPVGNAAAVSPITASGGTPLSSDTGFMLLMFGGLPGGANGANTAAQTSAAATDAATGAQGSGFGSLLSQLQSMVSSLTGNSSTTAGTGSSGSIAAGGTSASAGASSSAATAVTNLGSLDSALVQDLNAITSDAGTVAAAFGGAQATAPPGGSTTSASGASSGSTNQPSSNDTAISNAHSAWADRTWGDGPSGAGGGWQQFKIATYLSQGAAGSDSATAAAMQSVLA